MTRKEMEALAECAESEREHGAPANFCAMPVAGMSKALVDQGFLKADYWGCGIVALSITEAGQRVLKQ